MLEHIAVKQLKPREILPKLIAWLEDEQMLLILGARQVGKTSLLFLLIQHLIKSETPKDRIFYLDLEDLDLLSLLNSGVHNFIHYLISKGLPQGQRAFVFIDEIQYLDNPANFLKLLCDHHKNIKLICSGSSTLEIKKKFKDSIVGRKVAFELHSLNFREFLIFREQTELLEQIKPFSISNIKNSLPPHNLPMLNVLTAKILPFFHEYISYGGYPGAVLENESEKKQMLLAEIYHTYIRKDINQLFDIENLTAFNNLIRILAVQIGSLFNYHKAAANLGISRQTLEKYIFILQNTFTVKLAPPYYSNKTKEITKMPKAYFYDLGLRNHIIKNHQEPSLRTDTGELIENYVFTILNNNLNPLQEIKYWRTKSKNEIDFILEENTLLPIEVKYQKFTLPKVPAGISHFAVDYHPQLSIVVTNGYLNSVKRGQQTILFIPACLIN